MKGGRVKDRAEVRGPEGGEGEREGGTGGVGARLIARIQGWDVGNMIIKVYLTML